MLSRQRTGMSDAHLRPELRAQNPLYHVAGSVSADFKTERCPYHAMSKRAFDQSEQARRWNAILRNEKHIVQPPQFWMRFRLEDYARMSSPTATPVLRPSLSLGYASDSVAFHRGQSRLPRAGLGEAREANAQVSGTRTDDVREQFNAPRRTAPNRNRPRSRNRGR